MFPKVPQASLGILRVPQLPPPLGPPPPFNNPIICSCQKINGTFHEFQEIGKDF